MTSREPGWDAAGEADEGGAHGADTDRTVVEQILTAAGFDSLIEGAKVAAIEVCARALGPLAVDLDEIGRATLRMAAMRRFEELKIKSVAALVDAALGDETGAVDAGQGRVMALADPEPWPYAVDGAALLDDIRDSLSRYVVLPKHAAAALALWIMHTHAIGALFVSPILVLTSPQKRCGKTTVLDLLRCMVRRPLGASNITAAALFRTIEAWVPTLLVDEADTFLAEHEELRGILNGGHTRSSAQVVRTVGDDHEPRVFSTFAAKAIAAIGTLPGTIEDRAINVRMQRAAAGERAERIRGDRIEGELLPLRRQAARWAADLVEVLRAADPPTPTELNDRAADNWRPLLAIADAAGGEWPAVGRAAAVGLNPSGDGDDGEAKTMLLADLRDLFEQRAVDRLASEAIVEHLLTLEGRPWPEWRRGKPLTKNGLARQLEPFGVRPKSVRIGAATPKGYERADFLETWARYLRPVPGAESATTPQPFCDRDKRNSGIRNTPEYVADEKRGKPLGEKECGGVADGNPGTGGMEVLDL